MNTRIVLVETSHAGNIGAAARAMKNMGLRDLALVKPKKFPHAEATARASGADDVLARATVCDSLAEALEPCSYAVAASARRRTISWPEYEPREAAGVLHEHNREGRTAIVFGPETSGLCNEDLALCQALVCIPSDPEFPSLNLAMAVQLLSYELRLAQPEREPTLSQAREVPLATHKELESFYGHLEKVLTESGFIDSRNPRHLMRRLRRLFARSLPDQNEINILRGILAALWTDKNR